MANILLEELKRLDDKIQTAQPNTEEELIHLIDGRTSEKYGFRIVPVYFCGTLQGVRVQITPKSKTHSIPFGNKVYSVFKIFTMDRIALASGYGKGEQEFKEVQSADGRIVS